MNAAEILNHLEKVSQALEKQGFTFIPTNMWEPFSDSFIRRGNKDGSVLVVAYPNVQLSVVIYRLDTIIDIPEKE